MNLLDAIVEYDQQLLIYLNSLGSEPYDAFWLLITKPLNWVPFFLFWLFLLVKNFTWKKGLFIFLFICIMAGLSDVLVNIIKYSVERPRPCWEQGVMEQIRRLKPSQSFSFVSGHATTSMAVTTFMYLMLRNKYKWIVMFYIFPLLFAYSRIYMGKHYPIDIIFGYVLGIIEAIIYFKFLKLIMVKWFDK